MGHCPDNGEAGRSKGMEDAIRALGEKEGALWGLLQLWDERSNEYWGR